MNSIEFDENAIDTLDVIANALFNDRNDPKSNNYKRIHVRPKIRWWKIILSVFLPVIVLSAIVCILLSLEFDLRLISALAVALLLIYFTANLKKAIICLIHIYQRYAPDSIRNKCRFEPSCSQYMILAIDKYGLFRGIKKGINRLKRCSINDGGFDLP